MDILDALSRSNTIRHITTRHEQGAAFMADVHGRLTGRSAVAMATLGPGATNLVTGIADAFLDRAPMVAITGQVGSDKLHKEAHQFVDIVRMFEPVTKWNVRVERIDAIPEIVRKAFRVAELEKPGPTHIELPENRAQMPPESGDRTRPLGRQRTYLSEPPDEAIARAADLLQAAESPLILAGNGVLRRRASEALRTFAEALHIPVAVTFMGKGAIDDRHELSLMAVGLQARDHVLTGLRSGRPRRQRRLRPGRIRAGPLERRPPADDRPHRHAAGRGRRGLPARGGADRRHQRQPRPVARARRAARRRRARAAGPRRPQAGAAARAR